MSVRDAEPPVRAGHCLCGVCRFELTGDPLWVTHCHCESCRRATASPFTTWIAHANGTWAFTGIAPTDYISSTGRKRGFCPTCGTPMFFFSDSLPDEMHFYVSLLEFPEDVTPSKHVNTTGSLPWIHLDDGLPRD